MASYNELIALIDAYINQNGVQAITGQVLNGVLRAMVDQLGRGYTIMGTAVPSTDPGTPDGPESWFASTPGTYTDMGGLTVANAELALLSYTPSDGWAKTTLTQGIVSTSASVNNQVGTPSVTSSYVDGVLTFTFENLKGNTGDPAGFGAVTASVDSNIGTPSVQVQTSGPDTAKAMSFQFHNLKGETGVTSVVATVDNTTGNPTCAVSLVGQELHLDFTGLKGVQGDTGVSADYPITIANNLTTNDPTSALSAAMGVQLESEISQLELKVNPISNAVGALNWSYAYKFDKTKPSYATLATPITLSQEGDSIEIYVTDVPSTQNMAGGGYAFAGKNASTRGNIAISYGGSVYIRDDNDTWIFQYNNGATGSTRRVKIVYNASSISLYVDGSLVGTYNSVTPLTIYSFGNANNTGSYGYWSGVIRELKVNGAEQVLSSIATLSNVEDLGNHSFLSEDDLVDNLASSSTKKALTAKQGNVLAGMIDGAKKYDEPISALGGWKYTFNGTSSVLELTDNIVLQSNGDYIEIGIDNVQNDSLMNGGYGFCVNGNNIRIGLSVSGLYVRADDDTWLFQRSVDFNSRVLKLSYESGNVVLYLDGVSTATYTGQKKMTIARFGYIGTYGYWKGAITYVEANGVSVELSAQSSTDVVFGRNNGFLTDAQAEMLSQGAAEMYVSKSAEQIDIYQKIPNGKYIHYPFLYRYKAYTANEYPSFYDNWGIGTLAVSSFSGDSMADDANIFSPGEAELAVSVPSGLDASENVYVGGQAHGFENIVTGDNGREFSILINNQRIAEDGLVSLAPADKIEIIQHTKICQSYNNSNPFADVTKHWVWENGKMSCTTTLKVLRSLLFRYSQFGMFCVFRRWLGNASNPYLTNAAIKNNAPYKVWDISDGWSGMLQSPDPDCTRIVEYGQKGMGFAMSVKCETLQDNGGMFVATNGLAYNKIYFDMGRSFTPSVNDVLEATQTWEIF